MSTSPQNPSPLREASVTEPTPSDRSSCGWLLLTTAANFVIRVFCGVALYLAFVMAAGIFTAYYEQLDAELPVITQKMIDLQRFVTDYWYLYVLLLPIDTLVFLILASRSSRWRWFATVYSFLLPLVTVGLMAIAIIAFAIPFLPLLDDMKPPAAEQPPANQGVS